jgi:hypothetical protein
VGLAEEKQDQLDTVLHVQAGEQPGDMGADGGDLQAQGSGDLLVALAREDFLADFFLAGGNFKLLDDPAPFVPRKELVVPAVHFNPVFLLATRRKSGTPVAVVSGMGVWPMQILENSPTTGKIAAALTGTMPVPR